jgi:hypothetical protein
VRDNYSCRDHAFLDTPASLELREPGATDKRARYEQPRAKPTTLQIVRLVNVLEAQPAASQRKPSLVDGLLRTEQEPIRAYRLPPI